MSNDRDSRREGAQIEGYLAAQGVQKKAIASEAHWQQSKLSRVLSGETPIDALEALELGRAIERQAVRRQSLVARCSAISTNQTNKRTA